MASVQTTRQVACAAGRTYGFSPAATALLVIDMQRDFLAPDGLCGVSGEDTAEVRRIIPRIQAVLSAVRAAGMAVVHTREGYAPDLSNVHNLKRERGAVGQRGPLGRFLIRGEAGHDFIEELRPREGEAVVDKPGFGAFYGTDLARILAREAISHLLLCGVTTQCCVQSTLREAVDRGFYCLTLADCCAAFDPKLHEATLDTIQGEDHLFGWIASSDRLLTALSEET